MSLKIKPTIKPIIIGVKALSYNFDFYETPRIPTFDNNQRID